MRQAALLNTMATFAELSGRAASASRSKTLRSMGRSVLRKDRTLVVADDGRETAELFMGRWPTSGRSNGPHSSKLLDLGEERLFDLTRALAGFAPPCAEPGERSRVMSENPLVDDRALARFETPSKRVQLLRVEGVYCVPELLVDLAERRARPWSWRRAPHVSTVLATIGAQQLCHAVATFAPRPHD